MFVCLTLDMPRSTRGGPRKKYAEFLNDDEEEIEEDQAFSDFGEEGDEEEFGSVSSDDFEEEVSKKKKKTSTPSKKKQKKEKETRESSNKSIVKQIAKTTKKDSGTKDPNGSSKKRKIPSTSSSSAALPSSSSTGNKKASLPSSSSSSSSSLGGNKKDALSSSSTSSGGWQGAPIASEAAARKLIKEYMLVQNRPFSAIQVYDNLHHRVGKSVVQRVLDGLSEDGDMKCLAHKDYGKARIYFADQHLLQSNLNPNEISEVETELSSLETKAKEFRQQEAQVKALVRSMESEPPDVLLDSMLKEEDEKNESLRLRLNSLQDNNVKKISPADRAKVEASHKKYRTAWRARKEKVRDLLDMMADGMEKPIKYVTELVGIETDEECNVKIPPAIS